MTSMNLTTMASVAVTNAVKSLVGVQNEAMTTVAPSGADYHYTFSFSLFYGLIMPLVTILGIFGNICIVITFSHKILSSSCSYYLRALAVADTACLLCVVILYTPSSFLLLSNSNLNATALDKNLPNATIKGFAFLDILHVLITAYTLLATRDQYIYVVKTQSYLQLTKMDGVEKVTFVTLGCVVVAHIPNMLKLVPKVVTRGGVEQTEVCYSTMFNSAAVQIYDKYIYPAIFTFLSSTVLLCLGMALIVRRRPSTNEAEPVAIRSKMPTMFKAGRSTRTIVFIAYSYVLSCVPYMIIVCLRLHENPGTTDMLMCTSDIATITFGKVDPLLTLLSLVVAVIHSSSKLLIYSLLHSQFKQVLWTWLSALCRRKRNKNNLSLWDKFRSTPTILTPRINSNTGKRVSYSMPLSAKTEGDIFTINGRRAETTPGSRDDRREGCRNPALLMYPPGGAEPGRQTTNMAGNERETTA